MRKNINKKIKEALFKYLKFVDDPQKKGKLRVIDENSAYTIASKFSCHLKDVYITALSCGIYPYRYLRNIGTLSIDEQQRLCEAYVTIVGAGGLGGHVALLLARMGIGSLRIIDPDIFDETNLNRQPFCDTKSIGKSKAERAKEIISLINPSTYVDAISLRISEENVANLLKGSDLVIDALDNIKTRHIIEKAAQVLKIPFIHGAVSGMEGHFMTIFPEDGEKLQKIYGTEESSTPSVLVPIVALIAAFQAIEALKIIIGRGKLSRDVLLYMDMESLNMEEIIL